MAACRGGRDPGSRNAFCATYAAHAQGVYGAAYGVVRDAHLAEDIAQDVFLVHWQRPGAYDAGRGELGHYLRLMARSRALDARRRAASAGRARGRLEAEVERPASAEDAVVSVAERAAIASAVRAAVSGLPERQREAIALAYWRGMTADEIARRCGAPLGTVKSRIRLGLARLAADELTASAAG